MGPVVYFFGLQTTAASDASLLANAEMVFTILIASIAFREKLNRTGLLAVILVSIGVVVVTTNLQFSSSLFDFVSPGHLLILASGLCWGFDNNIITYASERIDVVKFIQFRIQASRDPYCCLCPISPRYSRRTLRASERYSS